MRPRSGSQENAFISSLQDYPHLAQYINHSHEEHFALKQVDGVKVDPKAINVYPEINWVHLISEPDKLNKLNQILSDQSFYAIAVKIREANILNKLLTVKQADLIYRFKFYHEVANLNLWSLDLVSLSNYLEKLITNKNTSPVEVVKPGTVVLDTQELDFNKEDEKFTKIFSEEVAESVEESINEDGTYDISATDPDIIKYIKSFINLVRSVKLLDENIKNNYISHLVEPLGLTAVLSSGITHLIDGDLQGIIKAAYSNSHHFDHLYKHFMAFKFYAGEYGDLISKVPVVYENAKELLNGLNTTFGYMKLGKAVNYLKVSDKKREGKNKALINNTVIPVIDKSQYEQLLDHYGIRTHLDALVGITRVMNSHHEKDYYLELSDKYSYPPSVSLENQKLMDTYNACSGARLALKKASEAFDLLSAERKKLPVDACWSVLSEDQRQLYIDFNNAMLAASNHISAMPALVKSYPKLRSLINFNESNIKTQIYILTRWKGTSQEKCITTLESPLSIDKMLIWLNKQIKKMIVKPERDNLYDEASDLYVPTVEVSQESKEMMLGYNVISRVRKVFEKINSITSEKFKFSHIREGINLLYEVGNILIEYRQLNNDDLLKKMHLLVEKDLSTILEYLTILYYSALNKVTKIEERQGLRKGLLMQFLEKYQQAYDFCLEKNNQSISPYKLHFHRPAMEMESVDNVKQEALIKVESKRQLIADKAYEAEAYLQLYGEDLLKKPFEIANILKVREVIKALPGHHASQYAELLQVVVNKLVGLDVVEREIRETEHEIKKVTGDNENNAKLFLNTPSIDKNLDLLKELYAKRAIINDMLKMLDLSKENPDELEDIQLQYFYKKGVSNRLFNGIISRVWDASAAESIYKFADGINNDIDLGKIPKQIEGLKDKLFKEISGWIGDRENQDSANSESLNQKNKTPTKPDEHQIQVNLLINNKEEMIKQVIQARKGDVVIKIENWRRLFIKKAKKTVQRNYRPYLTSGEDNMGIFRIESTDPLLVVSIKSISNTIVRVEQTMTKILKLADIPTAIAIENIGAQAELGAMLTELKISLNTLFEEMEIMTESLRALKDCLLNNTVNAFGGDIAGYVIQLMGFIKDIVSYPYININNEYNDIFQRLSGQAQGYISKIFNLPQQAEQEMIPEPTENEVHANINKNLVLFLKHSGLVPRATKESDGLYDLSGLEDGSVTLKIATLLNNHIVNGMDVPFAEDIIIDDNDYRSVALKVMKSLGDAARHISKVESVVNPKVIELGNTEEEQEEISDEDAPLLPSAPAIVPPPTIEARMILFLKEFINHAGVVNNGVYNLQSFKPGSLNKLIATFLNVTDNIEKTLNATVSMANGNHITGLISALWELIMIKRKIDSSHMLKSLADTLHQFNFDLNIFQSAIENKIMLVLEYIEPKIIDTLVKAKIAEVATGIKDDAMVSKLKVAVGLFVKISHKFVGRKFDYLLKDESYNNKTLEIAQIEMSRLKEMHELAELNAGVGISSNYRFLKRAVDNLETFISVLEKDKAKLEPAPKKKAKKPAAEAEPVNIVPVINPPVDLDQTESDLSDTSESEQGEDEPLLHNDQPKNEVVVILSSETIIKNVNDLNEACWTYKQYLADEIIRLRKKADPKVNCSGYDLYQAIQPVDKADEVLALAVKKYNSIHAMHVKLLDNTKSPIEQLKSFRNECTTVRVDCLNTRRDTRAMTVLKAIATALACLTVLLAPLPFLFGLWKPKGKSLVGKIDHFAPASLASPAA